MCKSLKKALLVLLVLLACTPKPATGSIVVHKAVVLVASLATKPVRGYPFEWWRVRVWEGKYYYIFRSGYYEALQQWEVESLEEAYVSEPEMAVFITGQSQMNWGEVGEYPPFWEVESQQWALCTRTPHTHMTLAKAIDLWQIWPGPKPGRGYWKDWQDAPEEPEENVTKWQCKWEQEEGDPDARSSSSRPARGPSRGRSPSKPAKGSGKVPWSNRYLSRGFHSQIRREERERLKARGEPVPPHLQVQQVRVCKELKKQMWQLQQRSRQNAARGPEEAEEPEEAGEATDVPMGPGPPEMAMPERGRSRAPSLNRGKMGPRSLTPGMGRGTPAKPATGSFLKQEVEEEEEEYEEEEAPEETGAKPVEAEQNSQQTRRKKRKQKPVEAMDKKEQQDDQNDGAGDGTGGEPSKPAEEPPLPPPPEEPDYGDS